MAAEPATVRKEAASKEAAANARPAKAGAPAGKKSKLPWLALAVAVLVAAASGAWLMFKPVPAAAQAADAAPSAAAPASAAHTAAIYYKFDPAFVVNFGGEGSARYLQIGVEAMSRDAAVIDLLKNNEPAVRNDLILLFSSQDSAALLSADGKEKLRTATLDAIRKVLSSEGADSKLIEAVYFTSFVIQ